MLCVECGKNEAKYDGLCEECFLKKVRFTSLPRVMNITICPHCQAVKFGGVWEDISLEDAVRKTVERNLKILHEFDSRHIHLECEKYGEEFFCEVDVHIKYGELEVTETHGVNFIIKYQSCPRCDRYFGNYFEAILQVRNMREDEENIVVNYIHRRIAHYAKKNRNLFLTREERKREGWDFYLSDKRDARKIARELTHLYGATLIESPQLAGRKDGRDVYRVTYSVRFPDYRVGDVISVDKSYAVVKDIRDYFVKVLMMGDYNEKLVDTRRHKIVLLRRYDELKKGMVIYSHKNYVQILGEDNRIIETRYPGGMKNGEGVRYFESEDGFYIVPESCCGNTNKKL